MSEIVNLRQARKAKARAAAADKATENRLHFGTSKAERALSAANQALERRHLDNLKRDPREKPASAFSHPASDAQRRDPDAEDA